MQVWMVLASIFILAVYFMTWGDEPHLNWLWNYFWRRTLRNEGETIRVYVEQWWWTLRKKGISTKKSNCKNVLFVFMIKCIIYCSLFQRVASALNFLSFYTNINRGSMFIFQTWLHSCVWNRRWLLSWKYFLFSIFGQILFFSVHCFWTMNRTQFSE